jgi:hypothetical protein
MKFFDNPKIPAVLLAGLLATWVAYGDGNAGDKMCKIRQGAAIKVFRLVEFAAV